MSVVEILIREARDGDQNWIANLMHNALEPYYGGDHAAHARRIFEAHISGGYDKVGFFSFEQKMFIAEINGIPAGMLHIVGKRQSTYKISPLIIAPDFQGQFGLGSKLLDYAENYAISKDARQLYCTVAEKNMAAMQFFIRKGFIKAGSSDSHYKEGVTETMLYKPLYEITTLASLEEKNISVLPFDENCEDIKKQVQEMLLKKLPASFEGIDSTWINALFAGHARRHTADVNAKYKLIYVALNNAGKVIGIAAATPKKGNPIKIMPLIAENLIAFEALLIDLPHQLVAYGHKTYIHIHPTAEEAIALQRLGWKLDAAMPSAYRPEIVMQQWSLSIGEKTMRTMRVKKRFFDLIRIGKKDLEVRVGYDTIQKIKTGEKIQMLTHTLTLNVQVKAIRRYKSFEETLEKEDYRRIAPDSRSKEEVLSLLKSIYPPEKEKLGVIVLELNQPAK